MAAIFKQVPWYVYASMAVAIVLLVAGFIVPPTGIIDGSVLTGVGEIIGGAALLNFITNLPAYIEAGAKAKIEHGSTSITIDAGKGPEPFRNDPEIINEEE